MLKNKCKKINKIVLFTILIIFILSIVFPIQTQASQVKEPISDKLNLYPGYTELINNIKQQHPNWNFTILYTGLDWSQVLKMETTAKHTRSLA